MARPKKTKPIPSHTRLFAFTPAEEDWIELASRDAARFMRQYGKGYPEVQRDPRRPYYYPNVPAPQVEN